MRRYNFLVILLVGISILGPTNSSKASNRETQGVWKEKPSLGKLAPEPPVAKVDKKVSNPNKDDNDLDGGGKAATSENKEDMVLLMLLGYVAQDYSGAVDDHGKVIAASEYEEMKNFSSEIAQKIQKIPKLALDKTIINASQALVVAVKERKPAQEIRKRALTLENQITLVENIVIAPDHYPDLVRAAQYYSQNCQICHGEKGNGQGPDAHLYDPKPYDFTSPAMGGVSPSQAFKVLRTGLPGTSMRAFDELSPAQAWDLAFYVLTFRHQGAGAMPVLLNSEDKELLQKMAAMSDDQFAQNAKDSSASAAGNSEPVLDSLEQLRWLSYNPQWAENTAEGAGASVATAITLLNQSWEAYQKGKIVVASELSLQSYLGGIELLEPRLKSNNSEIVPNIEQSLAFYRKLLKENASPALLEKQYAVVLGYYNQAAELLAQKAISPSLGFSAALVILIREGFEALLIIFAFAAILRTVGAKQAMHWMHGGWILGLVAGAGLWFISDWVSRLIPPANREAIEGYTGLFTLIVLMWVGVWLHNKSESKKWNTFITKKVRKALSGKKLWLVAAFSFIAVFREALETNLFLNLMWMEADKSSRSAILVGIGLAFVLLIGIGWLLYFGTRRFPIFRIFKISTALILLIAVILAGKSVHSFQELGDVSVNSLPWNFNLDALGIYPTWESSLAQLLFVLVILLFFFPPVRWFNLGEKA